MRSDPIKTSMQRAQRLERLVATKLPEMHIVGQIKSGSGIATDISEGVICRYKVDFGEAWGFIGGEISGQTQASYCKLLNNEIVPFNHPIDLHLSQAAMQGWGSPRISIQTYRLDMYGRRLLSSYGFAHIPLRNGAHKVSIQLWRPAGTPEQELSALLLGDTPALASADPLYESAWRERCRLISQAAGKVNLELFVVTRNLVYHSIDSAPN